MLKRLVFGAVLLAQPVMAEQLLVNDALDAHILPRYEVLAESTAQLRDVAQTSCASNAPDLRQAFGQAFDGWVGVSHIRTGPSEENERAFAIAFWPDTKGFTPKSLATLIRDQDPVVRDPVDFQTLSIAARGLYALEFLLYDPAFASEAPEGYHCDLVKAITTEIARNASEIRNAWQSYQAKLREPSLDGPYRDETETLREVYKALGTGLQFTADARLGRPLGTFERPRPKRSEARRSQRSLRHVEVSLQSTYELALILSQTEPDIQQSLRLAFDRALELAADLDDPDFSGVADPMGRFRVEVLQQSILRIMDILTLELAPALGVNPGFNALDGD